MLTVMLAVASVELRRPTGMPRVGATARSSVVETGLGEAGPACSARRKEASPPAG
jgi:hypothetical protein